MARCAVTHGSVDGFPSVDVTTGALGLTLIPALGGKVSSLRDLRSGREWLWRHPRLPYRQVAHGSSYVETADTGGWDECFPTVAPCAYPSEPWAGAQLQDHGELWSQAAEFEIVEPAVGSCPGDCRLPTADQPAGDAYQPSDAATLALRTRWRGYALPYSFERMLTLAAGSATVRADYRVTNTTDAALQFIWCAHPLLAIEPGMRLLLPPEARFNHWASLPADLLAQRRGIAFPPALPYDLSALPEPSAGIALKLWSDPLPPGAGWAAMRAGNGELRMRWDVAALPQVACWMNLGAWAVDGGAPYYNLGLEPCIGAQDSLEQAVRDERLFATVPPHATVAWWLEVELISSPS